MDSAAATTTLRQYKNVNRFQCIKEWFKRLSSKEQRQLRTYISTCAFDDLILGAGFTISDLTIVMSNLSADLPDRVISACNAYRMADAAFEDA